MIKIDGVQIKEPTKLKIERYNLTKSGRVASGDMTMDLVKKKKKLFLEYEVISGVELKQILDLIDGTKMFFTVEYEDYDGIKSMTCYTGAIPSEYFRKTLGWYWKGVNFDLIER